MCKCDNTCGCSEIKGYVEAVEQAEGDAALKLMLAETRELEAQPPQCVCPKCLSDSVEFVQLSENYTGRAFYLQKCKYCGTEFILLEDKINSCQRGIINCKQRIEYENKKIETLEKMMSGA